MSDNTGQSRKRKVNDGTAYDTTIHPIPKQAKRENTASAFFLGETKLEELDDTMIVAPSARIHTADMFRGIAQRSKFSGGGDGNADGNADGNTDGDDDEGDDDDGDREGEEEEEEEEDDDEANDGERKLGRLQDKTESTKRPLRPPTPAKISRRRQARKGQSINKKVLRRNAKALAEERSRSYHRIDHEILPNFDYPTQQDSWGQRLKDTLTEIDRAAKFANPGYEEDMNRARLTARNVKLVAEREESARDLAARKSNMVDQPSLHIVQTAQELEDLLVGGFERPIYIPAESAFAQENRHRELESLDNFWTLIGEDTSLSCQVQSTVGHTIEQLTKMEAQRRFRDPMGAINVLELDIPYHNVTYKPSLLRDHDVFDSMTRQTEVGSAQRQALIPGKNLNRFFLLSKANTCSATHIDAGGIITWVKCLAGSKWWYWGVGVTNMSHDDMALFTDYSSRKLSHRLDRQWSRLRLRQGDMFIMPPGMEHAVYTPEDSLFVGGFMAIRKTMHLSLRVMSILRQSEHLTNDDAPPQMFEYLSIFYHQYLAPPAPCDIQLITKFRLALKQFIEAHDEHMRARNRVRLGAARKKHSKKKGGSKAQPVSEASSSDIELDPDEEHENRLAESHGGAGQTELQLRFDKAWKDFVEAAKQGRWVKVLRKRLAGE